ncbi:hypothetical protein HYQ46_009330 [Verticillium longisporum]|nr:hypothetical protein HYQ46_009330 [Verticillium longisporum]
MSASSTGLTTRSGRELWKGLVDGEDDVLEGEGERPALLATARRAMLLEALHRVLIDLDRNMLAVDAVDEEFQWQEGQTATSKTID